MGTTPLLRWFWQESWEREAIKSYYGEHPEEGYRRISYMMLDEDVVAVSPSSVYRVLKQAGLLGNGRNRSRRTGVGSTNLSALTNTGTST